jgi:hypothetical protein
MTGNRRKIAEQFKRLLIESTPIIEEYTAKLCPACTDVCCKQKHGILRASDIRYLRALGETLPSRDKTRPLEGPCELMGPQGCVQPRWLRPFKCTWYFCEPLLNALQEAPPRKARQLSAMLQGMVDLSRELAEEDGLTEDY